MPLRILKDFGQNENGENLPDSVSKLLYVDDANLMIKVTLANIEKNEVQPILERGYKFAERRNLQFNGKKFQMMIVRNDHVPVPLTFTLKDPQGSPLQVTNSIKFLGIDIDSKLLLEECWTNPLLKLAVHGYT